MVIVILSNKGVLAEEHFCLEKYGDAYRKYMNRTPVNNDEKLLNEFRDKYPAEIFDKTGRIDRNLINSPALIDACEGISKLVEVERKDDSFIFVLESWGQLNPKTIIQESVKQITKQLDEVTNLIKK